MATLPAPPVLSLFIPYPVNFHVTTNTFVRYQDGNGGTNVGMITLLIPQQQMLRIRQFLSWGDLLQILGAGADNIADVSFWPRRNSAKPPSYLCDSSIVVDVPVCQVCGLAFVFYEKDDIVRQLEGMKHTYCVSSYFDSDSLTIKHQRSFSSFPSTFHAVLPTCFPSMIFEQMLKIKYKMQLALNTRSGKTRKIVTFQVENINQVTWENITADLPVALLKSERIINFFFIEKGDLIVQKKKVSALSFELKNPDHMQFAQKLFGKYVGLGVRILMHCPIGRRKAAENIHEISIGDSLNVVPFEKRAMEVIQRGITLKYLPSASVLSVTIRFRHVHQQNDVRHHLRVRGVIMIDDDYSNTSIEGNSWPLHSDTILSGHPI
jgi:hypothetical protein